MNKKEYITPQLQVVKIHTAKVIAISSARLSTEVEYQIQSSDDFGSRRGFDLWDDEDEY